MNDHKPVYMIFYELNPEKVCPHCAGSLGGGSSKTVSFATLRQAIEHRNDQVRQELNMGDPNPTIPYIWVSDRKGQMNRVGLEDDPRDC